MEGLTGLPLLVGVSSAHWKIGKVVTLEQVPFRVESSRDADGGGGRRADQGGDEHEGARHVAQGGRVDRLQLVMMIPFPPSQPWSWPSYTSRRQTSGRFIACKEVVPVGTGHQGSYCPERWSPLAYNFVMMRWRSIYYLA